METIGIAEAFYGEMYGNEHRVVAHNIVIRREDDTRWIGRFGDRDGEILIPQEETFSPIASQ